MDERPIGFFDSGLGGLTCIPHIMRSLPGERIIYFGDTARTPYGSKAPRTILGFAREIADFLVAKGVKMIAIACNTVSSIAMDDLRERHPGIPILGIIEPAIAAVAATCTAGSHVGVIGTKATIGSEAYPKMLLRSSPGLDVYGQACPALVPLIEEGIIQHEIMDLTLRYYLEQFLSYNNIDTLVLGCTHYPLVRRNIEKLYPGLRIIDPSEEMAGSVTGALVRGGLCAEGPGQGENIFYASDLSENFMNMIQRIFAGSDLRVTFKTVDIEEMRAE
ncbi:MAG: glutamate racemase [Clostridiales Family XIII bacterium]|jgi:glutamate racemase|nr:glutamate racemase [Clostridiales Family XIII bacterium]